MQSPSSLQSVVTYPVGAGLGQRIVIDGPRGAIFEYDNANNLVGSWASAAGTDPYGHAYPAGFSITVGSLSGNFFSINSSGFFIYSSAPALGNLIASITSTAGVDAFGNAYRQGIVSYATSGLANTSALFAGFLNLFVPGFSGSNATVHILNSGAGGQSVLISSGVGNAGSPTDAQLLLFDSVFNALGFPGATLNGSLALSAAAAAGQLLVLTDTSANPTDAILKFITASGNDKAIGITVSGRTFNSLLMTDQGIQTGPGTATQDTVFLRDSAGFWRTDTLLWDNAGSSEVWHALGTLTGATVNWAQYRMMPDGTVHIEIDVTWGSSTAAAAVTFSNTLPVAYRPPASHVDVRRPLAMTNGAGVIARLFIGQVGGGNPGAVQIVNLGAGNYIGTYSGEADYGVI